MPQATNGMKTCARCGESMPATAAYFFRSRRKVDGFNPSCKTCLKVPDDLRKKRRSLFRVEAGLELKTCTSCGKWKPASTEFFRIVAGKLGAECKECARTKRGTIKRASRNDAKEVDGILSKPCTKCGVWKPANADYFASFKQGKLGLHPWCRTCVAQDAFDRSLKSGRVKNHHSKPKTIDGVLHRQCSSCGQWLPASNENFQHQEGCAIGLRPNCRECLRQRAIQYSENNREKIVQRAKEWIKANPARHRQHALAVKAKRRAAEGEFRADDIADKLINQNGFCYYCGDPLGDSYEIDHYIPISKGGSHYPSNIVLACKACNRRKAAKDPELFMATLRKERNTG